MRFGNAIGTCVLLACGSFALGAENMFDTFPDRNLRAGIASPNGSAQAGGAGVFTYPINSPFGMNGRFVYSRVDYNF